MDAHTSESTEAGVESRQVPSTDPLVWASLVELRHYREASEASKALEGRVKPDLSPEAWVIVEQLLEARTMLLEANQDLFIAELIRHFPGYLSQADAVQMIDKCLAAPASLKFDIFDAISENARRWRDTGHAKQVLGWRPTGSSDNFNPDDYR